MSTLKVKGKGKFNARTRRHLLDGIEHAEVLPLGG